MVICRFRRFIILCSACLCCILGTGTYADHNDPPSNDDCTDAIQIGNVVDYDFTTFAATPYGPDSTVCEIVTDIWFSYTPAHDGWLVVDTLATAPVDDAHWLAIYTDCPATDDNRLACSKTNQTYENRIFSRVDANQTYFIQIGNERLWDWGPGLLTVDLVPLVPNDEPENALPIGQVRNFVVNGYFATTGDIQPYCQSQQMQHDVWLCFTAPDQGTTVVSCPGRYAVYDGCTGDVTLDDLIICSPSPHSSPGIATLPCEAGQKFLIQVPTNGEEPNPIGRLTVQFYPPMTNDDCADALPVGEVVDFNFEMQSATPDGPLDAYPRCDPDEDDVWFCYTASADGRVTVDLLDSFLDDADIAVFEGCGDTVSLDDWIACSASVGNFDLLVFEATGGESYKIEVDEEIGSRGYGDITITLEPFGACCFCDEGCYYRLTEADCDRLCGVFHEGASCEDTVCPTGGCCLADSTCVETTNKVECESIGGTWHGTGVACADAPCSIIAFPNGSFEDADLSDWTITEANSPTIPVQVVGCGVSFRQLDAHFSCSRCSEFHLSRPSHNCQALIHGWGGTAAGPIIIEQTVTVPPTANALRFDWHASWTINGNHEPTREFHVLLMSPDQTQTYSDDAVLVIENHSYQLYGPLMTTEIDVTAHRGRDLHVRFLWTVEGSLTSSSGLFFQLDNIRWACIDCNDNDLPDCAETTPTANFDPDTVGTGADDCTDARPITSGIWYPVSTVGATGGPSLDDSITCGPLFGQRSVFFTYTPAFSQPHASVRIRNQMPVGQSFVTAVYTSGGGCPGALIDCVAGNGPPPLFNAVAGETYVIGIAAQHFAEGQLELRIDGPPAQANAVDTDANGIPDACECLGDVNLDGVIDGLDFLQILHHLGACIGCPEDITMDGSVNSADLQIVLDSMGPCVPDADLFTGLPRSDRVNDHPRRLDPGYDIQLDD